MLVRTLGIVLLTAGGTATAQPAQIYQLGDPGASSSVSPGGVNNARYAVGMVGVGGAFYQPWGAEGSGVIPFEPPYDTSDAAGISETGILAGSLSFQNPTSLVVESAPVLYDVINGGPVRFLDIGENPDTLRGVPEGISQDGYCVSGWVGPWRIGDSQGGHTMRPVRWIDGIFEDIGQDDLVFFTVGGINNHGEMVGTARPEPGPNTRRAYAYLGGAWRDLGTLGGDRAFARDINNDGVIVGNAQTASNTFRGFRWDPGTEVMTQLDGPIGFTNAVAHVVNNRGDAAGSASFSGSSVAVYWPAGSTRGINLNDSLPPNSGWTRLDRITGMNDCGVFVGHGIHADRPGEVSGFLMILPPTVFAPGSALDRELCADANPITPCLPDTNLDDRLNSEDFDAWLDAFLAGEPAADQNSDGIVGPSDFGAWLRGYIAGC